MRQRPEDVGLLPDNAPQAAASAVAATPVRPPEQHSFTLGEAVRTSTLWLLLGAQTLAILGSSSLGFHQAAYYTDLGLRAAFATAGITAFGLAGAVSNTMWGFLSERFPERNLAILVFLLTAVVTVMLMNVQTEAMALLVSGLLGLVSRGEGTLFNILLARYFGRRSFGAITGFMSPFNMIGLGFGPLIAALAFDRTGSYLGVFTFYIFLFLIAALLVFLARPPQRPEGGLMRPEEIVPGRTSA
jgi:predicted MFS family arabinose efflux permease